MLERIFRLKENGTDIKTELFAGLTTFLAMAYIIFVQVQVMSQAGMDKGSIMVATCVASAVASIFMGIVANYPLGLAPGMGENFFFVYTIVIAMGVPWQEGLGMVFASGVLFMLLSIFKVREMILDGIPHGLKHGIAAGIGLLITFIGLLESGIVVKSAGSVVARGNFGEPAVILAIGGLVVTAILIARKIKGAILIGMFVTALFGLMAGILKYNSIVSVPPSIAPTFLKLDIMGIFKAAYVVPLLTLLYMVMFDTVGTLVGVSSQAGLMKDGKLARASKALFSDAFGTAFGALCGSSTVTAFVESVAGVKVGGRTGLTAVFIGVFFLLALFFFPLVEMVGSAISLGSGAMVHPVTAPALIMVGAMMMSSVKEIDWNDMAESIPAFLTIVAIPFTYSIADGIAIGFIAYPVLMLASGRGKKVGWLAYTLAAIFILRYIFLK